MNKIPLDPVTENKYVYGVSANHQTYQLATTLENLQTSTLIPTTYANGTQARVTGNYTYPLRLGNYLYSLPSLIFVGSGITNPETFTGFVIDKGLNLPYKLNAQTPENTQTITTQLQQLTGTSATLIFTGVEIPTNLTSKDLKDENYEIPEALLALGITDKDILGTAIFGNSYFSEKSVGSSSSSSSSSSGGGETPPEEPTPPPTLSCPTGYILVPGDPIFSTKDFCVMKYEAKNVLGIATSQAAGTPWVSITQPNAITACNNLGTGYHLITNNEWMTIARNIEANSQNWADGNIGSTVSGGGGLYRGNVNLNDSASCGSNTVLDGNTTGTNCDASGRNKRTHILSNNNEIWDISGNVWEHVNKANTLDGTGYATGTNPSLCPINNAWNQWSNCTDKTFGPSNGTGTSTQGVGQVYQASGTIFIRGGHWHHTTNAGVFSLTLNHDASDASTYLGFRCAFSVN